jgi:hypothetical protein
MELWEAVSSMSTLFFRERRRANGGCRACMASGLHSKQDKSADA